MAEASTQQSGSGTAKIWLGSYPRRAAPTSARSPIAPSANSSITRLRNIPGGPHSPHGQGADLLRSQCAFGGKSPPGSSRLGLANGDRVAVMMPQHPSKSRHRLRNPASRLHRRQRQSALYAARTGAPVGGCRRQARSSCSRTLPIRSSRCCPHEGQACRGRQHGDMLGPREQSSIWWYARQEAGPRLVDSRSPFFQVGSCQGRDVGFKRPNVAPGDVAFLQYTGVNHRCFQGRNADARQSPSNMAQMELWLNTAFRANRAREAHLHVAALPLYHIFALTVEFADGAGNRRQQHPDTEPARHPAFVKELGRHRTNIFPGLNTLFNALMNNPEFRKLDFSSLS